MNKSVWAAVGAFVGVVLTLIVEARPAQQRAHQAEARVAVLEAKAAANTSSYTDVVRFCSISQKTDPQGEWKLFQFASAPEGFRVCIRMKSSLLMSSIPLKQVGP